MSSKSLTSDELSGSDLEEHGLRVFRKMGLNCYGNLNHVQLRDIDPSEDYSPNRHLEVDYLIPEGETCIIGEITSRSNPRSVRSKHRTFRDHINILKGIDKDASTWKELGVPEDKISKFVGISELKGIFLTTQLERYDVDLTEVEHVAICFGVDCDLIEGYADTIGEYSKNHFLERVGVESTPSMEALTLREDDHNLSRLRHKKVASGDVPLADVYTFEANPYLLLPIAQVYRRDDFPGVPGSGSGSQGSGDYQRPLDESKIQSMRRILGANLDFMYPNNILCVLSDSCSYQNEELKIPKEYGSISVIDGQHRLFSFADPEIEDHLEDPQIMITAIRFRNLNPEEGRSEQINKYSAKTFVEINNKQTSVSGNHLDFIKYDILDDTGRRALAAKVILNLNERRGKPLFGIFDTYQTGLGVITPRVVISGLQVITNISTNIEPVVDAQLGNKLRKKEGYENLLDADIDELTNPDVLITKCTIALERYFSIVSQTFQSDWPSRENEKETSLGYAKVFHAFVKMFKSFIFNGYSWDEVTRKIKTLRINLIRLINFDVYGIFNYPASVNIYRNAQISDVENLRLFDPSHSDIPSARPKKGESFEFLERNLLSPTSIQTIMEERIRKKLRQN
jgi:DGQHR domain-containing protein